MEDVLMISQERLQELLSYDKGTGDFTWKRDGRKAGGISGLGYTYIGISPGYYLAHRLAFLYVIGSIPKEIDHINGMRTDNSWANLRPASHLQNTRNVKRHADNASGRKGVFFHKERRKWYAQICVRGVKYHLGVFHDPDVAHAAYMKAAENHFGEFARSS